MLMICRNCGTRFAVGASMCPQCTSTDAVPEGEEGEGFMPKINQGGPSNAGTVGADSGGDSGVGGGSDVRPVEESTQVGEKDQSPGNSSSQSSEKQLSGSEKNEAGDQKPAPTTGSRSSSGRTGSSSARSTGGKKRRRN